MAAVSNIKKKNEIVPWDTNIQSMFDEMRRALNEPFAPILPYGRTSLFSFPRIEWPISNLPSVDLADRGKEFIITADLPGYSKEDVDIRVTEHWLKIKAESKKSKEVENKKKNYIQKERVYSSFARVIPFPESVTSSGMKATMKNGVLEIIVPKSTTKRLVKAEKVAIS
ncbi:MAG: Hsp20/alpha crystallin family protein [archaeon]|nr:Hsp20/alpha crystallin family protein [archaeon]